MPSSKKTPNLHLNKWLGSDKPKKDDFVEDNEILDQAIGDLRGRLGQTGESAEALVQQAKAELEKKLADTKTDLESSVGTVRTGLSSHTDNGAVHVTQAQKESWNAHTTLSVVHVTQAQKDAWNAQGVISGSFQGNGSARQKIALGFRPKAGVAFAAGLPPVRSMWGSQTGDVYAAFFTSEAAGGSVSVEPDGFYAMSTAYGSDGYSYKLNDYGSTYGYMVWR